MKRFFFVAGIFPLALKAQDSTSFKDHRIYISPLNILTGDLEVTYSVKIGNRILLDPTIGYHYFPKTSDDYLGDYSVPERGISYYGPLVRIGAKFCFQKDGRNFVEPEITYKNELHAAACYPEGSNDYSQKMSGDRQELAFKVLFGRTNISFNKKFYIEPYCGVGAKYLFGKLSCYGRMGGYDSGSGLNCNESGIPEYIESVNGFNSLWPTLNVGFRIGWQLSKRK